MCGIVGYVGTSEAIPLLLNGLRRLEYRGYDSAGLAVHTGSGLDLHKCAGRIDDLADRLIDVPLSGKAGIAHTRWATHGAPTRANAHPLTDCRGEVGLVHNGVIENCDALRTKLSELGHRFTSETDTEVVAHLIEEAFEGNLERAVAASLTQVEGTLGLAVMSAHDPARIVVARRGAPLLLGLGEKEEEGTWVASDVAAVLEHTRNIVYLEDDEMAVLTSSGHRTVDLGRKRGHVGWEPVPKEVSRVDWDLEKIEKAGYPHFMLREIHEQPHTVRDAMRGRLLAEEGTARLGGLDEFRPDIDAAERIVLTGCGTSWHAALVGEYLIESLARLPVEVEYASEFRYRNPIIAPGTLVGGISQSGETADTLAAVREAGRLGAPTFGIVNVVGSTIARETRAGIYTHAGPEIGVASTKAFLAQVVSLALLGLMIARRRGMSREEGRGFVRALDGLPALIEEVLATEDHIRQVAEEFTPARNFLYLGRGPDFPIALEGALKLKEISYIHAEGYPAAEMKHGPIALIDEDMPVVFVAPRGAVYSKVLVNIEEVKTRGGRVIALVTRRDTDLAGKVDHLIPVPATLPLLQPIVNVVPLQLLAYHIAVLRGCDVDRPRNLAKTVTVE
ncbi:glutamine--fructose-6-phosphate transaminase (isomerizing) [Candidatus Palauibacter soopunensis]|uniref:glutamine--fructose-6-phosphate transaminase (isomerizing) n=1 Tax=Candidatus Palauibacter soopunensis TaxID=3056739 RepID=UPI0023835603|nr:glutamine--fructose-6-phosphate transaminase (isomerizing) [Candidatus Palauibacter soopunensis]MDE2878228.1 glutamine--fructose-6-phosphate transaminase (isomerizing) [Candidatus Palauibacter soopunensis]